MGREKGGLLSPESTLGSQTRVRVPARSSLLALSSVASGDDRVPPSAVFRGNGVKVVCRELVLPVGPVVTEGWTRGTWSGPCLW